MGVYISGMEMPDDGYVCLKIFQNGDTFMTKMKRGALLITGINDRIGTAIPIPPHGRLIDADDFIKQKTEQICENCDRRRGMKDGKLTKRFVYAIGDAPCRACGTGDMLDYVDDAPTVIPAEEGK